MKYPGIIVVIILIFAIGRPTAAEERPTVETVLGAIVLLQSTVSPNARTAAFLGRQRRGNGVVIDGNGLIATIGHVVLEADLVTITKSDGVTVPGHVIAYDNPTGLGLVRADEPLNIRPLGFADSSGAAVGDKVLVAGAGGVRAAIQAFIVSRRDFVGYWEYVLEDAIFTMPPYGAFGGAALVDADGRLLGIGSLFLPDAASPGQHGPGNMFVPVDRLKTILAELITDGRSRESVRPWLGMITRETGDGLVVIRAAADSPAWVSGIRSGSILRELDGKPIASQKDFYRRLWKAGGPGVTVRISLTEPTGSARDVDVVTADRYDWLKFKPGKTQ
jgi:serine protease Do